MLRILVFTLALASSAGAVTLTSSDIQNGSTNNAAIDNRFRFTLPGQCNGDNTSPQLAWSGAPPNTRSFALTIIDWGASPVFRHWVVLDIPHDQTGLARNETVGRTLPNGFGTMGYGGPCPPNNQPQHQYEITLWVLTGETPAITPDMTPDKIRDELKNASAESSTITGRAGYSDPTNTLNTGNSSDH